MFLRSMLEGLGAALFGESELEEAATVFEKAVKLDPKSENVCYLVSFPLRSALIRRLLLSCLHFCIFLAILCISAFAFPFLRMLFALFFSLVGKPTFSQDISGLLSTVSFSFFFFFFLSYSLFFLFSFVFFLLLIPRWKYRFFSFFPSFSAVDESRQHLRQARMGSGGSERIRQNTQTKSGKSRRFYEVRRFSCLLWLPNKKRKNSPPHNFVFVYFTLPFSSSFSFFSPLFPFRTNRFKQEVCNWKGREVDSFAFGYPDMRSPLLLWCLYPDLSSFWQLPFFSIFSFLSIF